MDLERRYSIKDVQEILGISERTVHRWIKSGKLKSYKPGRDHQIPESAIRKAIEESEVYPKGLEPPLPFESADEETIADKAYRLFELIYQGWEAEYRGKLEAGDSEWIENMTATVDAITDITLNIDVTKAGNPEANLARGEYMVACNEKFKEILDDVIDPDYGRRFTEILEANGEQMREMVASG